MSEFTGTIIQNGCCYTATKIIKNGAEIVLGSGGGGNVYKLNYLIVGGGGAGGQGYYSSSYGGSAGGGGGEVVLGDIYVGLQEYCITIGSGGIGGCYNTGCPGGDTILNFGNGIGQIIAHGGCGGQYIGLGCKQGGTSGSGCLGAVVGKNSTCGVGGGGASGNGSSNTGGTGICGMGGGGSGYSYTNASCSRQGTDGGGDSGNNSHKGCDATNYGGGGGGGGNSYNNLPGGSGCQGVVDICYSCDGSSGFCTATGGDCCYLCGDICVHRFTSNGTFTITG